MKHLNPWVFAMIFIGAFCYLASNNLEFPKIFLEGSVKKDAIILRVEYWRSMTGRGYVQRADIAFLHADSIVYEKARMDPKKDRMNAGEVVLIEHGENDPNDFRVIEYPSVDERLDPLDFYEYINGMRHELSFCNGILEKKLIKLDETLVETKFLQYQINGDTITVYQLFHAGEEPVNWYSVESRQENRMLIKELETNEFFKQQDVNFKRR